LKDIIKELMDKSTSPKSSNTIPKSYYAFQKNNKPDVRYFVYEIWEDKKPDEVIAGQKLEGIGERTLSPEQLDKLIPFWRQMATDKPLKHPILSIQVDLGNGSELSYGYTDGRKGIPPNAKTYIAKPRFDKNIMLMRHAGKQGKSIIYHSPLDSSTLREELENFNKLLVRFFNGKFYDLLSEHSDKSNGWEFHNEVVVDNAKLRNME
jgi:hypothetical protein